MDKGGEAMEFQAKIKPDLPVSPPRKATSPRQLDDLLQDVASEECNSVPIFLIELGLFLVNEATLRLLSFSLVSRE